jgi:hypothetical protein
VSILCSPADRYNYSAAAGLDESGSSKTPASGAEYRAGTRGCLNEKMSSKIDNFVRAHSVPEFVNVAGPRNRSLESIPGLRKRLQIRAHAADFCIPGQLASTIQEWPFSY